MRPFDLLVTDLVMPSAGGQDLYARLLATRPDLSDYPANLSMDAPLPHDMMHFLSKPFTARDLLERIRLLLSTN